MKTVIVNVKTKDYALSAGQTDGPFTFTVRKAGASETEDVAVKSNAPSASFSLEAGDYTVTVSKLGVEASASFTVESDPSEVVQVPDVVMVSFGDVVAAPQV